MTKEQKPKVDARALIARLNRESSTLLQREIIAPLLPGGRIRTRPGGMVHEFRSTSQFAGWGRFRPINEREAELLEEAMPWERGGYLELFPALRVVLLWPDNNPKRPGTWWAVPFNESDAGQRFGIKAEPLPIFLCDPTNGAERFERVIARVDGRVLWFEGPDTLADPTHAEWLRDAAADIDNLERFLPGLASSERMALLFWQLHQIETTLAQGNSQKTGQATVAQQRQAMTRHQTRQQQQEWVRQQATRNQLEQLLRRALAKADAVLHSYSEITNAGGAPGHLIVEWSEQGQTRRYRSTLDPHLSIVSSGICLSGRDRDFDLTSLVSVMTDSPWD